MNLKFVTPSGLALAAEKSARPGLPTRRQAERGSPSPAFSYAGIIAGLPDQRR